jgi:hypothetical protein
VSWVEVPGVGSLLRLGHPIRVLPEQVLSKTVVAADTTNRWQVVLDLRAAPVRNGTLPATEICTQRALGDTSRCQERTRSLPVTPRF